MYLIVCIDDQMGMMFNHRRQSMDSVLRKKIISLCDGHPLWMNEYTAKQFKNDIVPESKIDENYLQKAKQDDYCFVESDDITPYFEKIQGIILCRWNRTYPADTFLKIPGNTDDWEISIIDEFPGKSHEKITIEFWRNKECEN